MATQNFFALLGDDENDDDPTTILARATSQPSIVPPSKDLNNNPKQRMMESPPAKLPNRPPPPPLPFQAVRVAQTESWRGRRGRGGGKGGFRNRERDFEGHYNHPIQERKFQVREETEQSFSNYRREGGEKTVMIQEEGMRQYNDSGSSRSHGRGRDRGRGYGFSGDAEESEFSRHREYDRRSGTGRGTGVKKDGAGRGNWGVEIDQNVLEKIPEAVKLEDEDPDISERIMKPEDSQPEAENIEEMKEVEDDKEMTLEEYEKLLSEKRKALETSKSEERKVTLDKEFESMQLVEKKIQDEVFLKLSAIDKGKKKETAWKDGKSRKTVSINEFLKPTDREGYFNFRSRRGRGGRGRGHGGSHNKPGSDNSGAAEIAPSIHDINQFPTLGGK